MHLLVCDDYFARHSETIGDILFEGEPCATKPAAVAQIPFGYVRRAAIADNVFPIGDQLGVIPSFTGDGMCLALSSAMAAARAVLEGRTAAAFQSAFVARLRPQFRWASAIDAGFKGEIPRRLGSLSAPCDAARQDDAPQKRGWPRFGHACRAGAMRVRVWAWAAAATTWLRLVPATPFGGQENAA